MAIKKKKSPKTKAKGKTKGKKKANDLGKGRTRTVGKRKGRGGGGGGGRRQKESITNVINVNNSNTEREAPIIPRIEAPPPPARNGPAAFVEGVVENPVREGLARPEPPMRMEGVTFTRSNRERLPTTTGPTNIRPPKSVRMEVDREPPRKRERREEPFANSPSIELPTRTGPMLQVPIQEAAPIEPLPRTDADYPEIAGDEHKEPEDALVELHLPPPAQDLGRSSLISSIREEIGNDTAAPPQRVVVKDEFPLGGQALERRFYEEEENRREVVRIAPKRRGEEILDLVDNKHQRLIDPFQPAPGLPVFLATAGEDRLLLADTSITDRSRREMDVREEPIRQTEDVHILRLREIGTEGRHETTRKRPRESNTGRANGTFRPRYNEYGEGMLEIPEEIEELPNL